MLEATINKTIRNVLLTAGQLVDEIRIVATEGGLRISAMDESHIALTSIQIPQKAFSKYVFKTPEGVNEEIIGVNIDDLSKIFKRAGNEDITILHKDDDVRLGIWIESSPRRKFTLNLVEVGEDKVPPSSEINVDFAVTLTIPITWITETIKDAKMFGDVLEFIYAKKVFRLQSKTPVGDLEVEIPHEQIPQITPVEGEGNAKVMFSLGMLEKIFTNASFTPDLTVDISLADEAPARFTFFFHVFYEEVKEIITVKTFLAPRTQAGEDTTEGDA